MRPSRTLALASALAVLAVLVGAPAAQAATPRFGQVLLHADAWSGGVDVRSDNQTGCTHPCAAASYTRSPSGRLIRTGVKYDAVELALRVLVTKGWIAKALPPVSTPSQLYSAAPATVLDHHPVKVGYTPVPGDVIVWNGSQPGTGGRGKVAVVDRVSDGTVRYVQQGAASAVGTLVLGYADVRHVIGYLHARANTAGIPGTQTPAPNAVGDEALTSFVDPAGALQLFVLTSTGVVHDEQLPGHAWTSEVVATGRFRRIAAFAAGGALELYAIDAEGVERLTRTAGSWLPAQLVVGGTFTEIAALVEAGGAEDLFTLSAQGLRHDRLVPGTSWVGEPVASGVFTQISALQDPDTGLLHVFAIDGYGLDHFADLPGTAWGREVLSRGDYTQIVTHLALGDLLVDVLDADGVNGYSPRWWEAGWGTADAAVVHGRYHQLAAPADLTGQTQLFTLDSKGVLDFTLAGPPLGTTVVTGSFSQLSVAATPGTDALHVFVVTHSGITQATSPDGVTWTTSTVS